MQAVLTRNGRRFNIGETLGKGGFGEVFKGVDITTKEEFAVKIEHAHKDEDSLDREKRNYKKIGFLSGFLNYEGSGYVGNQPCIVLTLVGPTLSRLVKSSKQGKIELKSVLMVAEQLIERIRSLHGKGLVHRDIKPGNIAMGIGFKSLMLYLIDLGIAKKVKTDDNHHIPYTEGNGFRGSPEFASINAHDGLELSRRDDLESAAYTLIYLLKGRLPWSGIDDNTDNYSIIGRKKRKTSIEELCKGLEPEFAEFLKYARDLKFEYKPDYKYVKKLFTNLYTRLGHKRDYVYQWTVTIPFALKKKVPEPPKKVAKPQPKPKKKRKIRKTKIVLPPELNFTTPPEINFNGDEPFFPPSMPLEMQRAIVRKYMLTGPVALPYPRAPITQHYPVVPMMVPYPAIPVSFPQPAFPHCKG